jgi:UDP-N-acetylglucosamine 4,6-dehydratase
MILTSRFLTDTGPYAPAVNFLRGKRILVTGGTGSFGRAFVARLSDLVPFERLVIFSRDELKQYEMEQSFGERAGRLRFFLGDVRDLPRLEMAMRDIDYVIHAAALKQVPAAEYNPFECIHTNVLGAENVVRAALRNGVKRVIALSTDKASNPINLYGASKLASDKIFVAANHLSGSTKVRFSVVRYGNVVGSRGSVVPLFRKLIAEGADSLPITDVNMTRFWITLREGVDFVLSCLEMMRGGEIFVPKIPSMKITDLAHTMAPDLKHRIVGIRPGEKLHETMITEGDARSTVEMADRYVIEPAFAWWDRSTFEGPSAKRVADDFRYSSDNNPEWLKADQLRSMLTDKD